MCTSSDKPKPPPKLPEAPTMPDAGTDGAYADTDRRRRRAASGQAAGGTILTSSRGTGAAQQQGKTLLSGAQ